MRSTPFSQFRALIDGVSMRIQIICSRIVGGTWRHGSDMRRYDVTEEDLTTAGGQSLESNSLDGSSTGLVLGNSRPLSFVFQDRPEWTRRLGPRVRLVVWTQLTVRSQGPRLVEIIENCRQSMVEHLAPHSPEQPGQKDSLDSVEPGVLPRQPSAATW